MTKNRLITSIFLISLLFTSSCSLIPMKSRSPAMAGYTPGDISLGMPMESVLQEWGEPRQIQVAGEPSEKNQKWTYQEGTGTIWGLQPARIVYFEGGHVAGWETAYLE